MTQKIIDNAGAVSFNRDVTLATTTSASRKTKYFRKGPIQSTLSVSIPVLKQAEWRDIRGALAKDLIGPYSLTLDEEMVGPTNTHTITVDGASQTGSDVDVSGPNSTKILDAGDLISLPGVAGTYMVTQDVTTDSSGDANVNLDHPMASSPTNNGTVAVNDGITFSMLLVSVPQSSQGPTGLVAFSGSFEFVEDL